MTRFCCCMKESRLHLIRRIGFFSRDDLKEYGVNPPAYTRVCRLLGIRKENGCYPASLKDTLERKNEFPDEETFQKFLADSTTGVSDKDAGKEVFRIDHLGFQYLEQIPGSKRCKSGAGRPFYCYYRTERCRKDDAGKTSEGLIKAGERQHLLWRR